MVSLKTFLSSSVALIAAFATVEAAVFPSYPFPGSIQNEGQTYDITWTFDGKHPSSKYTIDFMTGSNDVQYVLSNVANNVDPTALKYSFTTPQVSPNAAVYFFRFTGSEGDLAWTTRFGIVGADGKLVAEEEKIQPNGDKIPWGIGKLAGGASATGSNATSIAASVESSSSAVLVPSADAVVASAAESPAENVTNPPSASTTVPTIAQVNAASVTPDSGASNVKPVLTLVSAAIAGYLVL
ncbi:hypothetical protein BD770DRAFT_435799 [Pilaira anomala]|nr:hypothetical protein BD770DRAFT_435799 [Pilaira anomala]